MHVNEEGGQLMNCDQTENCRCADCVASASSILEMYGYDPAEMDMHRQAVDDMPDDREAYYNERAERMP